MRKGRNRKPLKKQVPISKPTSQRIIIAAGEALKNSIRHCCSSTGFASGRRSGTIQHPWSQDRGGAPVVDIEERYRVQQQYLGEWNGREKSLDDHLHKLEMNIHGGLRNLTGIRADDGIRDTIWTMGTVWAHLRRILRETLVRGR